MCSSIIRGRLWTDDICPRNDWSSFWGQNSTLELENNVKLTTRVSNVKKISSFAVNALKIQSKCFPVVREMNVFGQGGRLGLEERMLRVINCNS